MFFIHLNCLIWLELSFNLFTRNMQIVLTLDAPSKEKTFHVYLLIEFNYKMLMHKIALETKKQQQQQQCNGCCMG